MNRISLALLGLLFSGVAHATDANVVYGHDDRTDVYAEEISGRREVAESAVLIAMKSALDRNLFSDQIVLKTSEYGKQQNLCSSERFYSQPAAGFCSGSLIGENLVLTAGHCVSFWTCPFISMVFGYEMKDAKNAVTRFQSKDIYSCRRVVAREKTDAQDYAIIELDRSVQGRKPLRLAASSPVVGDSVYIVGHPSGLPTKIAGGANVRSTSRGFYTANLDTFNINSGSPVFNDRNEVAGVLVRGDDDFDEDTANKCNRTRVNPNGGGRGEDVTDISYVLKALGH